MSQAANELRKTPLYTYYQAQQIQLTDFNGWALPIQFTKLKEEHAAVRNKVGLFETSHMGEILVKGPGATVWLNTLLTNDLSQIVADQAQYTLILNESGGIIDDLIVYKLADETYLFTPNASNTETVYEWFNQHRPNDAIKLEDLSLEYGLIAIQGPDAQTVLAKLTDFDLTSIKNYHFAQEVAVGSVEQVLVSRTGYTGEDGFELYVPWAQTESLWLALLKAGEPYEIKACGLGSRDTLRLEAGMSLYGQELSEEITPLEAGLNFAVKMKKTNGFIGLAALEALKETGTKQISRGFELTGKGIARQDYIVLNAAEEPIGRVTSGTQSPTFNQSIGIMLIDREAAEWGNEVFIQIRKKIVPAVVTKKNWLSRER